MSSVIRPKMRVVSVSDTHSLHHQMPKLPDADVFTHSGDFTHNGTQREYMHFIRWLGDQPYEYKVITPGNHDLFCEADPNFCKMYAKEHGIIYLQDEQVSINGYNFYGCPWTKLFGGMAFEVSESELMHHFDKIPEDCNVLLTHGPPYDVLDRNSDDKPCGSKALREKIYPKEDRPSKMRYCIFGHIHEGYGQRYIPEGWSLRSDRRGLTCINASMAGGREFSFRKHDPLRKPFEFNLTNY